MAEDEPIHLSIADGLTWDENSYLAVLDRVWSRFFLTFRPPPRACKKCGEKSVERESPFRPRHRDSVVTGTRFKRRIVTPFSHIAWVCVRCGYDYRTLCQDDPRNAPGPSTVD